MVPGDGQTSVKLPIRSELEGTGILKVLGTRSKPPLLGPEEKCLALLRVVVARNIYRPAKRVAEVVLLVGRGRGCLIEVISRIEDVVAIEFVDVAVEAAGSGLQLRFDRARRRYGHIPRRNSKLGRALPGLQSTLG